MSASKKRYLEIALDCEEEILSLKEKLNDEDTLNQEGEKSLLEYLERNAEKVETIWLTESKIKKFPYRILSYGRVQVDEAARSRDDGELWDQGTSKYEVYYSIPSSVTEEGKQEAFLAPRKSLQCSLEMAEKRYEVNKGNAGWMWDEVECRRAAKKKMNQLKEQNDIENADEEEYIEFLEWALPIIKKHLSSLGFSPERINDKDVARATGYSAKQWLSYLLY